MKAEAEEAVADVNAQLDYTLKYLKLLKKEHLIEIKSLGSPPKAVKVTITGLVIICIEKIKEKGGEMLYTNPAPSQVGSKKEEDYFGTAKRYLLNEPKELLDILMNFEKPGINN